MFSTIIFLIGLYLGNTFKEFIYLIFSASQFISIGHTQHTSKKIHTSSFFFKAKTGNTINNRLTFLVKHSLKELVCWLAALRDGWGLTRRVIRRGRERRHSCGYLVLHEGKMISYFIGSSFRSYIILCEKLCIWQCHQKSLHWVCPVADYRTNMLRGLPLPTSHPTHQVHSL